MRHSYLPSFIRRTVPWILAVAATAACCAAPAAPAPTARSQFSLPQCSDLPVPTRMHGSAVMGNRLYVIGGYSPSDGWTKSVWSAGINDAGSLRAWKREASLPASRAYIGGSTEVVGNRIYVCGGTTAAGPWTNQSEIVQTTGTLWTSVLPDGSLAPWQADSGYEGFPVSCAATCSSDKNIYVLGGKAPGRIVGDIWVADYAPDGAPVNWRPCGRLPISLWFHGAAWLEDRIYVWGGLPTTGKTMVNARVFSVDTKPDGSLGAWLEETQMPKPVYSASFCGFNDYLIAVAGRYAGDTLTNEIWFSRLKDKKVGTWEVLQTNLHASVYHALGLDKTRGIVFVSGGKKYPGANPALPSELKSVQAFRLQQPDTARLELAMASGWAGSANAAHTTLASVKNEAAKLNRKGLVLFYSPQVPACRRLWDSAISRPEFQEMVKPYVFGVVDSTAMNSEEAHRYSVFLVPCLAVIGPDGAALKRSGRVTTMEDVKSFLADK